TQLIPHSEYRPFSFNRGGDERRGQARRALAVQASSLRSFDPVAQYGLPLWASPGRIRWPVIRRIVAAIRLWRERVRSQQQLRELSDHMLKDIGLRREDTMAAKSRTSMSTGIRRRCYLSWAFWIIHWRWVECAVRRSFCAFGDLAALQSRCRSETIF